MLRRAALTASATVILGLGGNLGLAHAATDVATVIVHVKTIGGRLPHSPREPMRSAPWQITRLGPHGEALSRRTTTAVTIHVVPGVYKIGAPRGGIYKGETRRTLHAGQTMEVFLTAKKY